MTWIISAILAGISAFVATNIDDILILMLFFAQVDNNFRPQHIIAGQYLGFGAIILASLPGFFGGLIIPPAWIGFLGILPIIVGISRLLPQAEKTSEIQAVSSPERNSVAGAIASWLHPQTYQVAAVTFANGGDNIGIYVPLFAHSNFASLTVILSVFLALVGVWCAIAYWLASHRAIASLLDRYGHAIVPFVLIGLGIFILVDSGTFTMLLSVFAR